MDLQSFEFKKSFGQNFIKEKNVICNIVDHANIEEDSLVIEIGPGAGALTQELVKHANFVLAYEIDERLKEHLTETFKDENIVFIFDDFLNRNVKKDIEKYKYKNIYVIANLPYYITTPIITKIIEEKIDIKKIVVMVQKEVGDRFAAKPSSKEYNSLTVYLNYYFTIKKLFIVSRNVFVPKPNVDSIVVELSKNEEQIPLQNEDLFFKLVRDSFQYKRKNLKNNLKAYDLTKIEAVLKNHGYDLTVRAEQLSLEIFIEMSNALA